jgi:hypothetical protein
MRYSLSNQIEQPNGDDVKNTCNIPSVLAPLTVAYSRHIYNCHICSLLGHKLVTLMSNLGLTFEARREKGVKDVQSMLSAKTCCA